MATQASTCGDYYRGYPGLLPPRIRSTNPDSLEDRWVNYVMGFDQSPRLGDEEVGLGDPAWTLWDLPVSVAFQADSPNGEDLVVVAINNRLYWLDWDSYQDEWDWDTFENIYRLVEYGPLPSDPEAVRGYDPANLSRSSEVTTSFETTPDAPYNRSRVRVTVFEDGDESPDRTTVRATRKTSRMPIAAKAKDFIVRIEHDENEQFDPRFVQLDWVPLGRRGNKRYREAPVVDPET